MFTDPFGLKPDTVEVIIWRSAGSGSSSAGHVSVRVNDRSYSMAPSGMDRRSFAEYRAKQGFREGMGMQLNVTAQQEKQIQGALESDPGSYSLLSNNCTDPAQRAVEGTGVKLGSNLTPLGLANALIDAGVVSGVTEYPQLQPATGMTAPWGSSK